MLLVSAAFGAVAADARKKIQLVRQAPTGKLTAGAGALDAAAGALNAAAAGFRAGMGLEPLDLRCAGGIDGLEGGSPEPTETV